MDFLIKKTIFPLIVGFVCALGFYALYSLHHYGFGKVTAPYWFTGYDKNGMPIPFPVNEAISYWNNKGIKLSLYLGVVSFTLVFLYRIIKGNLTR